MINITQPNIKTNPPSGVIKPNGAMEMQLFRSTEP